MPVLSASLQLYMWTISARSGRNVDCRRRAIASWLQFRCQKGNRKRTRLYGISTWDFAF